ncbi:MAG: allantoinase AllB [Verrucomicrobiales bacterium]|nr:allantoinase AllB [Verrucomicrobiales bacterium]
MPDFDLLIRGAQPFPEIGIADGKIASFSGGSSREDIDATGLHVFPGVIDSHVHFNEPGRTDWEGIETGARALAAGGGTLFFDMPLNAYPPTCDAESFDLKLAAAQKKSITDFAFWGGLVPGNLDKLEELSARGVIGFKAFMANSGIEDFSCVNDATLREGMKRAAKLKLPVAVHAESETLTSKLAREKIAAGKTSIRDYLDSRPVAAELDAIRRAIGLAGETGCALHVVHVSSGEGVALIAAAKKSGVDVSCETCPHYLVLTEDDMEKLGAVAKCAPPLRPASVQESLWRQLLAGNITTIGSDHSPSPPELKTDQSFFKVWGGISGVQHTLPLLLTEGRVNRGAALSLITDLLSASVARRFKIPNKGQIAFGFDADFALVDLNQTFTVAKDGLFYRHRQSPYVGRALTGRVVQTILRGQTVFKDGRIVSTPAGRLVKPKP